MARLASAIPAHVRPPNRTAAPRDAVAAAESIKTEPVANIVILGPSPQSLGGMATVVRHMESLRYGGLYKPIVRAFTERPSDSEGLMARVRRHMREWQDVRRAFHAVRPAIAHLHTCSGATFCRSVLDTLAARQARLPVVLHVHGAAFDEFHDRAGPLRRALICAGLESADRVIALSQKWAKIIRRIAPAARVRTIENAVPVPARPPVRKSGAICRFLFLAKMDVWKGVIDLLDACRLLADVHAPAQVTLAGPPGSAGDEGHIRAAIERRGLSNVVEYIGPVAPRQRDEILAAHDVYLQPSHNEGMPMSILEALAAGMPIIATRVGAIPEMIDAGREGLVVPPRDPRSLANAMCALAEDHRRRGAMSEAAHHLASRRFSLGRFERDLVALYDGLLSER